MSKSKKSPTSIEQSLDEWAIHLKDRVMNASGDEKPSIAEETSAFKVVTLYYAYKMKLSPDPKDVEPFSGYAQQIADNRRGIGKGSPSGNNSVAAEHDF